MLDFVRRRFDELVTGLFLLLVAVLTILRPPIFATPGGLLLAHMVLWPAGILTAGLWIAARFSRRAHALFNLVLEFGPILVAVVGYVSLRLFDASAITAWLGMPCFDHWMMAADKTLFGKTPCLWFHQWGLDKDLFLRIMAGFYALYPLTPLIALAWFWLKRDALQFRLVRRALILSFYSGYCCYLLLPVAGPLSLANTGSGSYLESTRVYSFLADNFRYAYDCFPSLHTANPWLIVWLSRGRLSHWPMAVN